MAVNLSPIGGVAGQFFDNNGNPLVGGQLYTYAAGTTTPQTTFTSASGTTPNSNPIILNGGGRVPAEIWLTDGLAYKFVLYSSSDQLIGSWDNIVGINSNFVNFVTSEEVQTATAGQTVFTLTTMQYQPSTNNLVVYVDGVNQVEGGIYSFVETNSTTVTFTAGLHLGAIVKFVSAETLSTGISSAANVTFTGFKTQTGVVQNLSGDDGSDWIGFEPAGSGAVAMSVQDKLRETVSVKDFGAVGDGVADDSAAFALAMASNKTVYVPAGDYRFASSVTIPTSTFTKFIGEANIPVPASKITVDFDGPAFVSASGSTSFYCFENIFATVNSPAAKTNTAFVKDDGDAVHCNFKGLVLKFFKQPGILLNAGFVCCFDHVLIQNCYNYGIKVNGGSNNRFVRVLADFTDGGGIDAFGGGFVFDNFYSENSCQRNDPATFNESWRDINLGGTNHTIIGGIIASYPQNNKAPIRLANSFNTSIIGLRGFSLGAGAPSYVQIDGTDGGLVVQQSEGLTVSGFKRNLITLQADGGAGSYPDILLGQDQTSLWSGSSRAWACFDGVTGILKQSSGIQSLTRNAAGDYTITFFTDTFANANYVVNANAFGSGVVLTTTISAKLSTSVRFFLFDASTGTNVDSVDVMVAVNGF